ncbi:hypothetical protein BD626DRAFT_496677 [Schizophyllum amplum]|uniref:F-box domain-containing protein n=1 Tax=Schizophyllum amplum TaxID=97359 RepID=A0A550CDJ7_9AGAR|nr:hypothetical protein BD626DRAFT_496677 [Auriculariopsis ampla]
MAAPPACSNCAHALVCAYCDPTGLDTVQSTHAPPASDSAVDPAADDIAVVVSRIASVDAEIACLHKRIATLHRDRLQLCQNRDTMQNLRAPILRLPFELLDRIICAALPSPWYSIPCGGMVLPIAQTCRRLRATAHAISTIWSTVALPTSTYKNSAKAQQSFLAAVPHYLERTGNLPVHVWTGYDITGKFARTVCSAAIEWLIVNMHRIGSIQCLLSGMALSQPVIAPLLESASLAAKEDDISPSRPIIALDAPRLRVLALHRFLSPSHIVVPWSQLRVLNLELREFNYADLRAMGLCKSLTTLVLDIVDEPAFWEPGPAHIISLDKLQELKLVDFGHIICKAIAAPNLDTLSMSYGVHTPEYDQSPAWLAQCVASMLQRAAGTGQSGHPLRAMRMDGSTFFADEGEYHDFLSVLLHAPALRHLELEYAAAYYLDEEDEDDEEPNPNILRSLILRSGSSESVVPRLEHLKIDLADVYSAEHAELLKEIALSRWADDGGDPKIRLTLEAVCRDACSCATRGSWQSDLEAHGILVDRRMCTDLPSVEGTEDGLVILS